jgi:hypothetical protein
MLPQARSHKMNLLRSGILSTQSRVHPLVPYPSLTLPTFSEDDEKIADPYSFCVIGMTIPCYVMEWY